MAGSHDSFNVGPPPLDPPLNRENESSYYYYTNYPDHGGRLVDTLNENINRVFTHGSQIPALDSHSLDSSSGTVSGLDQDGSTNFPVVANWTLPTHSTSTSALLFVPAHPTPTQSHAAAQGLPPSFLPQSLLAYPSSGTISGLAQDGSTNFPGYYGPGQPHCYYYEPQPGVAQTQLPFVPAHPTPTRSHSVGGLPPSFLPQSLSVGSDNLYHSPHPQAFYPTDPSTTSSFVPAPTTSNFGGQQSPLFPFLHPTSSHPNGPQLLGGQPQPAPPSLPRDAQLTHAPVLQPTTTQPTRQVQDSFLGPVPGPGRPHIASGPRFHFSLCRMFFFFFGNVIVLNTLLS